MATDPIPSRSALAGTAVLMTCACGTASNTATLVAMAGVGATTTMVHPLFIVPAAALIVYGLWRTREPSGRLALAAFGFLAVAAALTPPRIMSTTQMPWNGTQIFGAGLYLVAAGLLAYAFWRAFPSRNPSASGTAIGGMVLATGCTCCMFTGALAGIAATGGAGILQSTPVLFWTGLAIVAFGLYRLAGWKPVPWVAAGGVVIEYMPELLRLTGDWMVGDANLRTYPSYMITLTGAGLILYAFVVAYRASAERDGADASSGAHAHRGEMAGA